MFGKLFKSQEVKAVYGVLDELQLKHDERAFAIVRQLVEKTVEDDKARFEQIVRDGRDVREFVLSAVANYAGDILESGRVHSYRGELDPLGPGQGLLRIFDDCVDRLLQCGAIDGVLADKQKRVVRSNIEDAG